MTSRKFPARLLRDQRRSVWRSHSHETRCYHGAHPSRCASVIAGFCSSSRLQLSILLNYQAAAVCAIADWTKYEPRARYKGTGMRVRYKLDWNAVWLCLLCACYITLLFKTGIPFQSTFACLVRYFICEKKTEVISGHSRRWSVFWSLMQYAYDAICWWKINSLHLIIVIKFEMKA